MNTVVKNGLIRLRASQPFNALATSGLKGIFDATGLKSEFVIRHLHRMGTVECDLPNRRKLRVWSKADDWVSNQLYWRGWQGYEPETASLFLQYASRSNVTIDVGAYVGFFTLLAAHANPAGRVFSFEPLAPVYDRLRRNIELNELTNVECINAAVGEGEATADFFHIANGLPTSSSLSHEFMSTANDLTSSSVKVVTLDTFAANRGLKQVDLLKIDTESTEPDVLRGAAKLLARDRPNIFCEVLKGRGAEGLLEKILKPLGYRFYLLTPEGAQARERIEGHPEWLNYLFATEEPGNAGLRQAEQAKA